MAIEKRPHGPGTVWLSSDGRIAVVDNGGSYPVALFTHEAGDVYSIDGCRFDELDGEWMQFERPAFPVAPPKPHVTQCLVYHPGTTTKVWRTFSNGRCLESDMPARNYTVVPHEDNDQDAIYMIGGRKVCSTCTD